MANTISALKRVRITERRTAFNRTRRSKMRTAIKSFRKLLAAKQVDEAVKALPETYAVIDKAAKVGVIKKNTAARYKSRLTVHLKELQAK